MKEKVENHRNRNYTVTDDNSKLTCVFETDLDSFLIRIASGVTRISR